MWDLRITKIYVIIFQAWFLNLKCRTLQRYLGYSILVFVFQCKILQIALESMKSTLRNKILANAEKLSYISTLRIQSERACKATKVGKTWCVGHTYYTCTIQIKLSTCDSENFTRTNVHVERIDQEQKVCTKFFSYGK